MTDTTGMDQLVVVDSDVVGVGARVVRTDAVSASSAESLHAGSVASSTAGMIKRRVPMSACKHVAVTAGAIEIAEQRAPTGRCGPFDGVSILVANFRSVSPSYLDEISDEIL